MKKFVYIFILFSIKINAQVFYQDFVPDVVINTWNEKEVHIDSVCTSTLSYGAAGNLSIWRESTPLIRVNAFSNCQVLMSGAFPLALNNNDLISSSGTWTQPNYAVLSDVSTGNWTGLTDKYLGVRVKNGAQWLYGWIRMDVSSDANSFTIKDYACNRAANFPINAGQSVTGIEDYKMVNENVIITPNPFNNISKIVFPKKMVNETLIIYNAFGQIVKQILDINGNEIFINRDNLPAGVYSLTMGNMKEQIVLAKLVVVD